MDDYEQLLESALSKIPKKEHTRDRFQVPEIATDFEGNKTIIRNFVDIANALRREPKHIATFLFKELATPGAIQGNSLILQTRLTKDAMQKKLDNYVATYVFCKVCGEPDTKFVKEGRITMIQCDACGAKTPYKHI